MKSDILIVLDLDETLFHCDILDWDTPDFIFNLDDTRRTYYSITRPYFKEFISYIEENFNYAIFTSADEDYAMKHIEFLKLNPVTLLSRQQCTPVQQDSTPYLKDLNKLTNFAPLNKILAIDDKLEVYIKHPENLIKVIPFHGNKGDDVLLALIGYLEEIKNEEDVMRITKKEWYKN